MNKTLERVGAAAAVGLVALVAVVGPAVPAGAAGQTGPHAPAEVSCHTTTTPQLQVHAPYIRATYIPSSTITVGPANTQWVGFRAHLLRWNGSTWVGSDQNRDGYLDRGPLYQAQVTSEQGGSWMPPSQWYNTTLRRWQPGTHFFPIRDRGYYRVRVEYFWYSADGRSVVGSNVLDSQRHFVTAGWSVSADPWCRY